MSKERALLVRAFTAIDSRDFPVLCKEIEELLAQPEQNNTQYLLEQVSRLTAENAMLKEKWSTPKRESLSYSRTADLFHANKKATNAVCYWAGVYDAEKAHDITGVVDEESRQAYYESMKDDACFELTY